MNFIYFLDVVCGSITIPTQLVSIISTIYTALLWGVPLILIIVGMFDMGKAITQQKEDEIKKAQTLLVKKAVAALLVFLMLTIVKLVMGIAGDDGKSDTIWNCINQLVGGKPETTQGQTSDNGSCTAKWEGTPSACVVDNNNCKNSTTAISSSDAANCSCTCQ